MRYVLAGILILGLVVLASQAYAADTADITVYVKIQTLSVAVNPATYDFQTMTAGQVAVAVSSITVTNDGNVNERFSLQIPSKPNETWTSVTEGTVDAEEYRLSAVFRSGAPLSGDYGLEDSFGYQITRTASATVLAKDTDGDTVKGFDVGQGNDRALWFKFEAPSATDITTQQSIIARVTALAQ